MNYLSSNLKFLRSRKKYSQQRFSNLLKIQRGTFASYENGGVTPPISVIVALSEKLNTTMEELVFSDMREYDDFVSEKQRAKTRAWLNAGNQI